MTKNNPLIGLLHSQLRIEEKWIINALKNRKVKFERIDDRQISLGIADSNHFNQFDVILARSLSYSRTLNVSRILNSWGVPTVNHAEVVENCGDKLRTSLALERECVPQPRATVAFSPGTALKVIEEIGYPVVLKPVIGSWGRLLSKINDRDSAKAILEHKSTLGSYMHSVFYVQEYVHKPGRDIRAFVIGDQTVCAIYRTSSHWITNTARGGAGQVCPVTHELNEICMKAANAVGGGILAIDLLEHPTRGLLVLEVNHTMEFHTTVPLTKGDIPNIIVDYLLDVVSEE